MDGTMVMSPSEALEQIVILYSSRFTNLPATCLPKCRAKIDFMSKTPSLYDQTELDSLL